MERKKESAHAKRRRLEDWFCDKVLPRIFLLIYSIAIAFVAIYTAAGYAASYPPGAVDADKQSLVAVAVTVFLVLIAERSTHHTL